MDKKLCIKIKPKRLFDEYVLTNKQLIIKYKYILTHFDYYDQHSNGLVVLTPGRVKEAISDQDLRLDSSENNQKFMQILEKLREWHPLITRVTIDTEQFHMLGNLDGYQFNWGEYEHYFKQIPYNKCILSEPDFDQFKRLAHTVCNINVHFKLVKRIEQLSQLNVNFSYLHKMLTDELILYDEEEIPYYDEISVTSNQLPFSTITEPEVMAYPYVFYIPLFTVNK
jgi:hypothetical protein